MFVAMVKVIIKQNVLRSSTNFLTIFKQGRYSFNLANKKDM